MSTHGFRAFESTSRLGAREQTDEERYGIPENFLEIEVKNPQTHGRLIFVITTPYNKPVSLVHPTNDNIIYLER
jgi:hypothetical protein